MTEKELVKGECADGQPWRVYLDSDGDAVLEVYTGGNNHRARAVQYVRTFLSTLATAMARRPRHEVR